MRNVTSTKLVPILVALLAPGLLGADLPADWHVDRSLYPKAYGVLANEHLMFPVDMSDWPVKIDRSHQLFVDDYLIAKTENITRQVHPATKHPRNPLLVPDKPWEGSGCVDQRVLRDAKTGRFRMWYGGCSVRPKLPSGTLARRPACYAESKDGLTWEKPELGLFAYEGSKANNIVLVTGCLKGIFHDPRDPDPKRRYKGLVWFDWRDPKGVPPEGYYLHASPDGIHWTRVRDEPAALNAGGYTMPCSGVGDTTTFRWDRRLGKYIGDVKFILPGKMRCRGMMESDDLIHWTRPRMTIYPDALDEPKAQIYGHIGFVYESMWIGLVRVMHTDRVKDSYKQTTVELTASRDGRHWTRVGKRDQFILLGKPDAWDPHYQDPATPPIRVGDELWFYYRSLPLWGGKRLGEDKVNRIGLATLRHDGFVSLNGGTDPGTIVTRPLTFQGKTLFVNAKIAEGGYVKAELRGTGGKAVEPYTLKQCKPVTGNVMKARVTWEGTSAIDRPQATSTRLVFELKNAKLYSFWIE